MAPRTERKPGRNEPCWCGSGKKYKSCHLRQDEQVGQLAAPKGPVQSTKPIAPLTRVDQLEQLPPLALSPEEQAEQVEWEKFGEAELDGKIAFFLERLENNRIDATDTLEAYFDIRDETDPHRDAVARARLTELIDRVRRDAPEVYRQGSGVYLRDLVQFAVAEQRWEALPSLLSEFAEVADKEIEDFSFTTRMLLYHGQTPPLLSAMTAAWPKVSKSDVILDWGIDEFFGILLQLHLYRYLETTPRPRPDDPALREPIQALGGKPSETWLTTAVQHMSVTASSAWKAEDFGREVDAETWEKNVSALLFEFMADIKQRAGIPFSRSDFFKEELQSVLHQQISEHEPQPRGKAKKGKPQRLPAPTAGSPLVPRYDILDHALAEKFSVLSSEPYEVGAVIELLPAYLHWIARLGLIHPTEMDQALAAFQPLSAQALQLLDAYGGDIYLLRAIETAWSDAALDALHQDSELWAERARPIVVAPTVLGASEARTYRFKVRYERAEDVGFIIEIGSDQTLDHLHYAIQDAANFDADHMYAFYLSGRAWDTTTEYGMRDARHSSRMKIGDLGLRMKQHFLYLFDFGDEHHFDVQLIATSPEPASRHPRIVERHGKMPPQYPDWDEEDEELSDDDEIDDLDNEDQ